MINELIFETIKQDSLDTSFVYNNKLIVYYFVKNLPNSEGNIPPPPIFRNEKGEEPFRFDEFKSRQKYWVGYNLSREDSIFIEKQIDTANNIILDSIKFKNIIKAENLSTWSIEKRRKTESYTFYMPLLNYDKTIAWVGYDFHCPGCGRGQMIVFRKKNKSWEKFSSYITWTN